MENEVMYLKMEDIIPNRFQPREVFDEKALATLAESIKQHGVLEPILVRPVSNKYEIIAGERRYKASALAGLTKIPALVRQMDDKESAIVAFVENAQRKDVSAVEEAKTIDRILKNNDMTQEELAKLLGIGQSTLANKLRLLSLPTEVQDAVMHGEISERHARSLLAVKTSEEQLELLQKIKDKRMTVRELDGEIKSMYNNSFIPNLDNNGSMMNNTNNNPGNGFVPTFNGGVNPPQNDNGFMDFLNQYDNNNPTPAQAPTVDSAVPVEGPQVDAVPLNNSVNETMPNNNFLNNYSAPMPTNNIPNTNPKNDSFMSFLNQYDNNNPLPQEAPVTSEPEVAQPDNKEDIASDTKFMSFLNQYNDEETLPNEGDVPVNNNPSTEPIKEVPGSTTPADDSFMSFLNQYDNNNPLPQEAPNTETTTDILNDYMNIPVENTSENNNVLINDVNPPITTNFDTNDYVENNPNYTDVSVAPSLNSIDEIIGEIKETVDRVKAKSKYKIDTDEINFDDIYQITIKVDKRDL